MLSSQHVVLPSKYVCAHFRMPAAKNSVRLQEVICRHFREHIVNCLGPRGPPSSSSRSQLHIIPGPNLIRVSMNQPRAAHAGEWGWSRFGKSSWHIPRSSRYSFNALTHWPVSESANELLVYYHSVGTGVRGIFYLHTQSNISQILFLSGHILCWILYMAVYTLPSLQERPFAPLVSSDCSDAVGNAQAHHVGMHLCRICAFNERSNSGLSRSPLGYSSLSYLAMYMQSLHAYYVTSVWKHDQLMCMLLIFSLLARYSGNVHMHIRMENELLKIFFIQISKSGHLHALLNAELCLSHSGHTAHTYS